MGITEWYNSLTVLERIFLYSATFGGTIFLLRTALMLIGGLDGQDVDDAASGADDIDTGDAEMAEADASGDTVDADVDEDSGRTSAQDAVEALHLFTLQNITAFLMMGGIFGLACTQQWKLGGFLSAVIAFGIGFASMLGCAYLVKVMMRLQDDGTIRISNALYQKGEVYLTVKPGVDGGGKVQLELQERLMIYNAVTEGGDPIPTGSKVVVSGIRKGSILVVEKL